MNEPKPNPDTITQIRCVSAVQLGAEVVTSIVASKDIKLSFKAFGVQAVMNGRDKKKRTIVVPYSNLSFVALEGE